MSNLLQRASRAPRQAFVVAGICAVAILVGGLSVYAGVAPLAPGGAGIATLDDVRCPAPSAYVDPVRLREALRARMERVADMRAPEERRAVLAEMQTLLCRSIQQGPADGRDWAWLLFAAPGAARDADVRRAYYDRSYATAPLEVEAVYWRVVFDANRWGRLDPDERKLFLTDADTLARMPFGYRYISVLAALGARAGPELTAILRDLVVRHAAANMDQIFDSYVKNPSKQER